MAVGLIRIGVDIIDMVLIFLLLPLLLLLLLLLLFLFLLQLIARNQFLSEKAFAAAQTQMPSLEELAGAAEALQYHAAAAAVAALDEAFISKSTSSSSDGCVGGDAAAAAGATALACLFGHVDLAARRLASPPSRYWNTLESGAAATT